MQHKDSQNHNRKYVVAWLAVILFGYLAGYKEPYAEPSVNYFASFGVFFFNIYWLVGALFIYFFSMLRQVQWKHKKLVRRIAGFYLIACVTWYGFFTLSNIFSALV